MDLYKLEVSEKLINKIFESNKMGTCVSTLTLSPDLVLSLKANPDKATLLSLQLHYSCYDSASQKKIDELSQIAIGADHHISLSNDITRESVPLTVPKEPVL